MIFRQKVIIGHPPFAEVSGVILFIKIKVFFSFTVEEIMDLQAISIDYCIVVVVSHDSFDSFGMGGSFSQ